MKHFLIIDDDETFTYVLGRAIKKKGYPVVVANRGDAALALLGDNAPDLPITHAVLDLKLAETNGLQLLPQLLK